MSADITLRKGLTIPMSGMADLNISSADIADNFVIYPHDFHGVVPKMLLKEGEAVLQGQPIFYSKANPEIKFVSPVSGTLTTIERGAKRRIMSLSIAADRKDNAVAHKLEKLYKMEAADVKKYLLESGCWPFVKQRPYDVIADPTSTPKAIFISGFSTAPLAADVPFILSSQKEDLQNGIDVLAKLAPKVHLSVDASSVSFLNEVSNAEVHRFKGPHPAGNVGVQIHHIDPVNAGETVWVVGPADVARIGAFFSTGIFDASQMVAVVGPVVKSPTYFKTRIGAVVAPLLTQVGIDADDQIRVINGDSLSGVATHADGNLGFYNNTLTV